MRALAMISASVLAALAGAGAAHAQEPCLYGGPDPAADFACGPAGIAPARPAPVWSGQSAQARIDDRSWVSRTTGAAQSRILAGGRVMPAQPALPYGYEYDYSGPAQAGTYAYAYESADGGAWAWRQDTHEGPAWAYSYETPEGWAYAWAQDAAPAGAPPPAAIEIYPGHDPYAHGRPDYDWRYSESRLYGASYPRQLYLVETYYRDTGWVTVDAIPLGTRISCGACGVPPYAYGGYYGGYGAAPAPRGGVYSGGGGAGFGSGFSATGSYLVGGRGETEAFASQRFSESNTARMTNESFASARGNQNVVAGAPFAPPAGAPVPPWGPPPQMGMTGPTNAASASAGANAGF